MTCRVSVRLISWINAASVEDLPEPVGPLTRIRPCEIFDEFLEVGMQIELFDRGLKRAQQPDGQSDAARGLQNVDAAAHAANGPRHVKRAPLHKRRPLLLAQQPARQIPRAVRAAMGSPVTRNAPRTRTAAGMPASRCRSLAPLAAADSINDSNSM